ncbi:MAG: hypothetical protein ACM3TT_00585 [Syntrophothermus sp.]
MRRTKKWLTSLLASIVAIVMLITLAVGCVGPGGTTRPAPSKKKPAPTRTTPTRPAPTRVTPTRPTPTSPSPTTPAPTRPSTKPTRTTGVAPTPTKPAPTKPSTKPTRTTGVMPTPTRPAPTRPSPAAPAPTRTTGRTVTTPADLRASIQAVKMAVDKKQWSTADREASRMGRAWTNFKPRTTKVGTASSDIAQFEAAYTKLKADIKTKNKTAADRDLQTLMRLSKKFK